MKIMVVGSGGREHALCWKLSQSPLVEEVLCAPGNAGITAVARCVQPSRSGRQSVAAIAELAVQEAVDLVVVGPEAELAQGLVDLLQAKGIPAFGPTAAAAQLEASKAFAKEVMAEAAVPTAAYSLHQDYEGALAAVRQRQGVCVIKADGLAAGKGVMVCRSQAQAEQALDVCFREQAFGAAGQQVLVEELLEGEELSVLALCDGQRLVPMVAAQDHKAALDGDQGPNTGGMGAYCPAPLGDEALLARVRQQVLEPVVRVMAKRGTPLVGVLYAGLMVSPQGDPSVLEFNVRFGDPETQPLLALLASDLVPVLQACVRGELPADHRLQWRPGATVCVVMASAGYPGRYELGQPLAGLELAADQPDVVVFHAGTKQEGDRTLTAGGRVVGVTAWGEDVARARERAYAAVASISFAGAHYRQDIAHRAIGRSV